MVIGLPSAPTEDGPPAGRSTAPVLVLIGPPGSGKSTVGALLATRLGVALRDTDVEVEHTSGRSVADIFVESGEPAFRALECAEVQRSLSDHDGVLALGGGAIMDPDTQERLAGQRVVYLKVGIADAARRVGFDQSRPLLMINPRGQWLRLMEARRATYERLASVVVDTSGRSPQQVAAEVIARLDSADEPRG